MYGRNSQSLLRKVLHRHRIGVGSYWQRPSHQVDVPTDEPLVLVGVVPELGLAEVGLNVSAVRSAPELRTWPSSLAVTA